MEKQKFSRLPELARPLLYDIYLKPNLESFEFHGTETISLEVGQNMKPFFYKNELRTEAKHSFGPQLLVLISSLFLLSNIIFKSTPTFLRPCSFIQPSRKGGSCFWRRIRINRLYIFSNHRATLY